MSTDEPPLLEWRFLALTLVLYFLLVSLFGCGRRSCARDEVCVSDAVVSVSRAVRSSKHAERQTCFAITFDHACRPDCLRDP